MNENIILDEKILNKLFMEIRLLEATNIKTSRYDDSDMIKLIINNIINNLKGY